MIEQYQVLLGSVTVALTFVALGLYLYSSWRHGTKPHPLTWLLLAMLDGTVFVAQVMNDGGPGAWPMGVGALLAVFVFLFALKYGEKRIARVDWICLFIVLTGIVGWIVTSNAFIAVVLISFCDFVAKIPTFRKAYLHPYEESITVWSVDIPLYALSIAALSTINWTTALFPAEIAITNTLLVALILSRRRQLARL